MDTERDIAKLFEAAQRDQEADDGSDVADPRTDAEKQAVADLGRSLGKQLVQRHWLPVLPDRDLL